MRRLLFWVLPWLGLSIAIFASWMHLAVLDPSRLAWLLDGNDHGQAAVGLAAYLRGPPPWPSLHSSMLMAPEGLPLALTDSNPLLGLLLRPFAAVLPVGVQYLGLWLFACILLHMGFAAALVRRYAPDPFATWIGAVLLTLMPVLLARFGHVNLCAQWLILWALWIFVDARRASQPLQWVAVIVAATLIHPYLLVMVAAIWASAMLRRFVLAPDNKARGGMIGDIGLVAAPLLFGPMLLGTIGTPIVAIGGYGGFSMALDALWNPNIPSYSALLPAASVDGSQGLEGMNYLGAGLLALVLVALFYRLRHRDAGKDDPLAPLLWLVPAFVLLTLVAMMPHLIWRGQIVATLPVPGGMARFLDPIRAAGRMFWPVDYVIALAAIAMVCRMRRGTIVLAAALLLQIIDLTPLFAFARGSTASAAQASPYRRTLDPRWDAVIARADMVEFEPPEPYRDLALMEEVAWRAIVAGRPVRYFYASREPVAVKRRLAADALAFNMGQIDPRRLYVLLDGKVPPGLAGRVTELDGVTIIAPAGADSPVVP
ncbi:MAG: hypothetical protein JWN66_1917 [Sphingomonas bacterium]|uniref:DUF6311 domain-containing protein n=1 Tax=Sphingomonas bacterium TaxID=1895847 RepID=UPI00262C752E|nr:DUF6311 domain-containing protein [Sphingomonas bacterium]MDB5704801.1 hypothetical protein [Sphingomonas bacterium]